MKKIYQTTMAGLAMAFLLGGVIILPYFLWRFERYWHYRLSYESMVRETVRKMVKQEALKPSAEKP